MALATLPDVKKIGRITGTDAARDEQLTLALEAAEEWVIKYLKYDPSVNTLQTAKFFDVRQDGWVPVPAPIPGTVVNAVRAYGGDTLLNTLVSGSGYEVQEGKVIRLRPFLRAFPFEGAAADQLPGRYTRVEVDYTGSGAVPKGVRNGTAMIALDLWQSGPSASGGALTSERIGDYSYTVQADPNTESASGIPALARTLLRPHRQKRTLVP